MFWLYGGGFVMGDATEENYLPGPLLDRQQVDSVRAGRTAENNYLPVGTE